MPDDRQGSVAYTRSPKPRGGSSAVEIVAAEGVVLGPDGFFHPLEGDGLGGLKTSNASGLSAQEEEVLLLRGIAFGIAQLCGMSLDDLLDAVDGE